MLLGRQPAGKAGRHLDVAMRVAGVQPSPERAQGSHGAVGVLVSGRLVPRRVGVLEHPHPLVLEDHLVVVRVARDRTSIMGPLGVWPSSAPAFAWSRYGDVVDAVGGGAAPSRDRGLDPDPAPTHQVSGAANAAAPVRPNTAASLWSWFARDPPVPGRDRECSCWATAEHVADNYCAHAARIVVAQRGTGREMGRRLPRLPARRRLRPIRQPQELLEAASRQPNPSRRSVAARNRARPPSGRR